MRLKKKNPELSATHIRHWNVLSQKYLVKMSCSLKFVVT